MNSNRKITGFTLVELLVVIAVIAVILGVLMPALAGARRSSKQLMCAANVKQIYAAFASYANQNADVLIRSGELLHAKNTQETLALWHIALLPYVGEKFESDILKEKFSKVWFCPEDKDPYPRGYKNNPHNGMTSYAMNGYYANVNGVEIKLGPGGGFKFSQINNPSDCMMTGETSYASQFYDSENDKTIAYNLARDGHHRMTSGFYHKLSMNISFVDGHIGNIKGRKVPADAKYIPANYKTGKYMFWPQLTLPTAAETPLFWGPRY